MQSLHPKISIALFQRTFNDANIVIKSLIAASDRNFFLSQLNFSRISNTYRKNLPCLLPTFKNHQHCSFFSLNFIYPISKLQSQNSTLYPIISIPNRFLNMPCIISSNIKSSHFPHYPAPSLMIHHSSLIIHHQ